MKIYLISRLTKMWDSAFDSAVVAAPDEQTARDMNPATGPRSHGITCRKKIFG